MRVQHGRARDVRIDIEGNRLRFPGSVDFGKTFECPPVIGRTGALMVGDHHRDMRFPADFEGLIERFENVGGFVPHVSGMDGSRRRQCCRELDDLFRRGCVRGRVEQPRAHAHGAGRQRVLQSPSHPSDLARRGRAIEPVHGADSQRRVADLGDNVDGRRIAIQR